MAAFLLLAVLMALVVMADRLLRRRTPELHPEPPPIVAPVIVEAVLSARPPKDVQKAARYEAVMRQAVLDCLEQGIPLDDPRVRVAVLAARDAMRASYR